MAVPSRSRSSWLVLSVVAVSFLSRIPHNDSLSCPIAALSYRMRAKSNPHDSVAATSMVLPDAMPSATSPWPTGDDEPAPRQRHEGMIQGTPGTNAEESLRKGNVKNGKKSERENSAGSGKVKQPLLAARRSITDSIPCPQDDDKEISPAAHPDELLPHLIPGAIRDALVTDGFAVIPGVLSSEECDHAITLLWDFVEDVTSGRVSRTDPATWYPPSVGKGREGDVNGSHGMGDDNADHGGDVDDRVGDDDDDDDDPWPHTGYRSFPDMFQSLGAGYVLTDVKEWVSDRVFAPHVFGTRELHCSHEGFTFARPTVAPTAPVGNETAAHSPRTTRPPLMVCGQAQLKSTGEHYDQAHSMVGLQGIQSLTALEDQLEDVDGCFLCYPRSFGPVHKQLTRNTYRGRQTWFPLTDSELDRLVNEFGCRPARVYLRRGEVLLWRSDLVHAPQLPSGATTRFRAVSYCSAQPACLTPSAVLNEKLLAYKQRQTGDHRVSVESWHSHRRSLNRPPSLVHRSYYRTSPPLVTVRQAQLFGLIPYYSSGELAEASSMQQQVVRAVTRGVRFRCASTLEEKSDLKAMSASTRDILRPPILPCDAHLEYLRPGTDSTDRQLRSLAMMQGQDKYLGGMESPCGTYVYGVPGSATRVLRIHVRTRTVDWIGPEYKGKFKWLRGVTIPASSMQHDRDRYPLGCCVALPSNAPSILKVNPANHEVYSFGESCLGECGDSCWLYHGGNLASNGYVYAIPANANRVCKFHPANDSIELIGPSFEGKQMWYGGIVGADQCIYGIPHNAQGVLKIDPLTDDVTLLYLDGGLPLSAGSWKWHGGLRAGDKIIGFPNNADEILVIDTSQQRLYTVGDSNILKSGRHRSDNRYKYLGGALAHDGRFAYLFPCDAERVLRFDFATDEIALIGPLLLDGENKFQNGFCGRDGCLYGIPQRACGVLRIVPRSLNAALEEDHVDIMDCGEDFIGIKDKFEGGVMGGDECMYCIPLRSRTVVKIVPGPSIGVTDT